MRHPVDYAPSQDFGDNPTSRIYPGSPDYWIIELFGNYQPDGHTGTDYPCPAGTPVRAAADGIVLHVGYLSGSYADNPWWISPSFAGYVAVIDHGHFIGIYGHCLDGSAGVRKGDRVREGDVFIRSGNTGASTGDHLHFECLPDGYILSGYMYGRINPAILFAPGNTIAPQSGGTITLGTTTSEEDDMFSDADRTNLEKSIHQQATIIGMLDNVAGAVTATPSAILDKQVPRANNPEATTSLALFLSYSDADREATVSRIKDAIAATPAAELAVQIDAAGLAESVRDELVKLLAA